VKCGDVTCEVQGDVTCEVQMKLAKRHDVRRSLCAQYDSYLATSRQCKSLPLSWPSLRRERITKEKS
jgi:hypothetical protein